MSKIEVNAIEPQCGTTLTLGASGDTVTLGSGASQSGFGRTGTVDWDTTAKTATFSAVSGNGYFCNTTAGAFTVNLPAGAAGAIVSVADYAATWQTNNLTVSPNGSEKIGSAVGDATLSTEGQSVTFVYVDSTQGWINTMDSTSNVRGASFTVATGGTILTCGNYKIHVFTGPGTFCVSSIGNSAPNGRPSNADYTVVAGGGGSNYGAGGAGGFRNSVTCAGVIPLSVSGFPITVGSGGAGTPSGCAARGSNSVFSSITSTGGGASGGCTGSPSVPSTLAPGGSGAGGPGTDFPAPGPGSPGSTTPQIGGVGNTPPVSPPQGNPGGSGHGTWGTSDNGSGGGGGAGAAATNTTIGVTAGTPGGAGAPTSILGSTPTAPSYGESGPSPGRYFAGGGAGTQQTPGSKSGGVGGGGDAPGASGTGTNGLTNMGGGGGDRRGSGGSGIVIIRYKFQ